MGHVNRFIAVAAVAGSMALGACAGSDGAAQSSGGDRDAAAPAAAGVTEDATSAEALAGAPLAGAAAADGAPLAALDAIVGARQLVRNAELELTVADPGAALEEVRSVAIRFGGVVTNADVRTPADDAPASGTVVLRVPSDQLDAALADLEGLGDEVRARVVTTQDVTEEHTDVAAQIRNLEAYETELLTLLADVRAQPGATPEHLLTVFDRVRGVRDEIERLQGRLNVLDDMVALSTITLRLVPAETAPALAEAEPWRPGVLVREAFTTLRRAFQGVATVAIWLGVVVVPVVAALALPVVATMLLVRRSRRRPAHAPPLA